MRNQLRFVFCLVVSGTAGCGGEPDADLHALLRGESIFAGDNACKAGDETYDAGETFSDGCNQCTCNADGSHTCTKRACVESGEGADR